jgi:hypothetical protein
MNRNQYLAQELRYHAQNNEMIDQWYTEFGALCNEIADVLDSLPVSVDSSDTGTHPLAIPIHLCNNTFVNERDT